MATVPPLRESRVLLADDDPLIRTVYVETLRAHGCEVVEARNGSEALTLARTRGPGLVLLDLSMPVMNGWEALAAIRADAALAHLVVVALTGSAMGDVRERAAAAGFDGFIVKPFTPKALLSEVEAAWTRTRAARGDTPPAADPPGRDALRPEPAC